MAGFLHKFLKRPSSLRIITSFNHLQPSRLAVPFGLHQPNLTGSKSDNQCYLNPVLGSVEQHKPTSPQLLQVYPSFPFGYCLNQIPQTGFDQVNDEEAEAGSCDTRTIWADSVKKKRKRKMNKHKYKKLRKRLRRQT
ncbi:PREDICTED: uncharacterized protein LOC104593025 [Nelumbo nucifera]|uniref:Small ribosomal subunit protein mS38 n=2 Tax=Nelumbo nucifera TaxID=4432 RepID=A0A822YS43_NELNU|nr:PREDICTED: uncharacterized protein LOC104593025 [Nelumbo nucifera]DAD34391.1 TPA_asm: hypothetical protein HUJ06_005031 [Nelumbo nucifera]